METAQSTTKEQVSNYYLLKKERNNTLGPPVLLRDTPLMTFFAVQHHY